MLFAFGCVEIVGAANGGGDLLRPLEHVASAEGIARTPEPRWQRTASNAELDAALRNARGRPVLLDFYADWCVSCREMERFTFGDPRVASQLAGMALLRADMTANDEGQRALLKRFGLFGPPGVILFDAQGHEVAGARVIGLESAERFLATMQQVRRNPDGRI